MFWKRKRIGLVLGGGGARGLAHIGALRGLEREKIPILFVSHHLIREPIR